VLAAVEWIEATSVEVRCGAQGRDSYRTPSMTLTGLPPTPNGLGPLKSLTTGNPSATAASVNPRVEGLSWLVTMMLDRLIDHYVEWRESARAVGDAYARWCSATAPECALRYAAYLATLDQSSTRPQPILTR
jgi:hypothetical protein